MPCFIEAKGRRADARTVSITRNEMLAAFNAADAFVLAVVLVEGEYVHHPLYLMLARSRELSCSQSSTWLTHQLHARIRDTGQSHTGSLTITREEIILGQVSKNYAG